MKAVIITLALAGLASTAPVGAQILGSRLPTPATNTSVGINGSWQVVGRDGSGNTIYERRTQDRNGNIVVQRARRDSRGNMSIISTNTIGNTSNRSNNCAYNQSTNTVGDIIFGRTNTNVNCNDVGNRVDGGWYQVGQGSNNNSVYERRVRDANGNLVIQRARRNSNGTFTILNSRGYNTNNDRQWQKAQLQQQKDLRKQQKQQDKQYKNSQRGNSSDNRPVLRADDASYVASNTVAKGKGHGKDNGNGNDDDKGKHKDKN
jgi:hypothetical protein